MTKPLTAAEFAVLRPYARGTDMAEIAKATRLDHDRINGIIMTRTSMNRQHAAELVRQHMRDNAAEPDRPATATAPSTLDAILTAGEGHTNTRIRALAVKARTLCEDLRVRLEVAEQERKANAAREETMARIRKLEQELASARNTLPARVSLKKATAAASEAQKARAWAADNGIEVGPNGRLPDNVLNAYREAHPSRTADH